MRSVTAPLTLLMLAISARTGALGNRTWPRTPMFAGPVVGAAGGVGLPTTGPGTTYRAGVLPFVVVLGQGLSLTVAPLTATALSAVEPELAPPRYHPEDQPVPGPAGAVPADWIAHLHA